MSDLIQPASLRLGVNIDHVATIRNARGAAVERLLDKALLDPDVAMELLKDNNPANRAALARKAKGWLGNEASTFVNLMNEDDDETSKTIMEGR